MQCFLELFVGEGRTATVPVALTRVSLHHGYCTVAKAHPYLLQCGMKRDFQHLGIMDFSRHSMHSQPLEYLPNKRNLSFL